MPTSATPDALVSGLTYAVADLHGRYDLLEAALDAIHRHAEQWRLRQATVVFLGDYVDRGPQSAKVIGRLLQGPPDGWRWVCLKGNHEAMMSLALRNADRLEWWIGNGGDTTIVSYREHHDTIRAHLSWIDALPSLHRDDHRVFVHAGVNPAMPLDAQAEKTLLWKRYPKTADEGYGDLHLVHGHDPHLDGPIRLIHRTALDTLAWRAGRLVLGVFDDTLPGGPIDLIEVHGKPASS